MVSGVGNQGNCGSGFLAMLLTGDGVTWTNFLAWVVCIVAPLFALAYINDVVPVAELAILTIACLLFSLLIVATKRIHVSLTADCAEGVQKVHSGSVPRIGGVGIFMVMLIASTSLLDYLFEFEAAVERKSLMQSVFLCGLPVFLAGIVEDLTKSVSVRVRLIASFVSGIAGAIVIGAVIPRFDVVFLDHLMEFWFVGLFVTGFCVAGVTNAFNIIDGFNGLASGVVAIIGLGLAMMAHSLGDTQLVYLCLVISGACLGFMVINFFTGKLFLGDGGAYFLGFTLVEAGILLVARHQEVSPWVVLIAFFYPVLEVLVSIVRRKVTKADPSLPDRDHLHHRIQRAIIHARSSRAGGGSSGVVNSSVSKWLWVLTWSNVAASLLIFSYGGYFETLALVIVLSGGYLALYIRASVVSNLILGMKGIFSKQLLKEVGQK